MLQLIFRRENASEADANTATSSTPLATAASNPFRFGTSAWRVVPAAGRSRAMTSAVSAICGTQRGDTKLPTSIVRAPAASKPSIRATLVSGGMTPGSFWSPSRGPTSTMRTCRG